MPPSELCKYISLSSHHAESILSRPELYFSRPIDFNDISDCKPFFRFDDGTEKDREAWYETSITALARNDPRYHRDRERELKIEYMGKYPQINDAMIAAVEKIIVRDLRERIVGVLSVTQSCTDPVMYLHYADRHKGVCLRFTVRADSFFDDVAPVVYQSRYPIVDFFDQSNNEEQFKVIFLTKYDGWKYEQEWRVVDFIRGPGLRAYPAELLSGVVFGIKTTDGDKIRVREWLSRRGHPVKLYQARQQPESYQLAIDPIV